MSQPFDHSRYEWYPAGLCGPETVCTSSGSPRPALPIPLKEFVVHYGGAGTSWTDYGDTAKELASVEMYARSANKPNEYNSSGDSAGETWEYAGRFRSAGNGIYNMSTWSHLALYGLENLTEVEAQGLIKGIRRARQQCVDAGYLTADHVVNPHNHYKSTGCPGPLWTNKRWWNQITAPLTSPTPPPPPPSQGDDTVLIGYVKHANHNAVYRQFSNGTKTWITDGDEFEVYAFVSGKSAPQLYGDVKTMPNASWMKATGVIVGPLPEGVDAYGVPVQ